MEFLESLASSLLRNFLGNLDLVLLFGAYYLMSQAVRRKAAGQGWSRNAVADVAAWTAMGALVGGRLGYVLPTFQDYLSPGLGNISAVG